MKNDNEKKGLFQKIAENKKAQKGCCCCNLELEEIPEEKSEKKVDKHTGDSKNSCC